MIRKDDDQVMHGILQRPRLCPVIFLDFWFGRIPFIRRIPVVQSTVPQLGHGGDS